MRGAIDQSWPRLASIQHQLPDQGVNESFPNSHGALLIEGEFDELDSLVLNHG